MFRVTRCYEFSASHRLHSAHLNDEANRRLYGKCNNPFGHGHNYVIEVSVRGPADPATGRAVDTARLDALVRSRILQSFDHRNLNTEIAAFADAVPTSENLGYEICRRLKRNWKEVFPGEWPRLDKVRIGETPRNIFEIRADEIE
ncbi:MAG TPA: 6-carboxytetrahydropterin synthase [Candidatus Acidoferrales bacterium]|nr:6-carboxytetrahydropterin synthase [Candidatus Acidoferrales bacterium]HXK05835.1 6-carboxytetrahydropterin synthase [Verrucomicrobiae bacterium]